MKKFSKFLFIVVFALTGYTETSAQNTLNVWLKSGIIAYYDFTEQPKITYEDANMIVTTPDVEVSYPLTDLRKLTFLDNTGYSLADLNADSIINVGDITLLVNLIMENYMTNSQTFRAADINQDKVLNVGDITTLVNLIMGNNAASKRYAANLLTILKEDGSNETLHNVAIYNETGELVQQLPVSSAGKVLYNTDALPKGNYTIQADGMKFQLKKK